MSATPAPAMGITDTCGVHNANLAESTLRVIEGGSWKVQSTVILVPAAKTVATKVAMSWLGLMNPPNQAVQRISMLGMEVGEAYSTAIEQILAQPQLSTYKYLLTLEHDNLPPPDGLLRLLARMEAHPEFACIGGLYWTKGPGGVPQIWGDAKDPVLNFRPQPPEFEVINGQRVGKLVECCGTGMGFNLWRLEMFKDPRLRKPWFKTIASMEEGVGTQDLYAWSDFRKHGYRCAIDCSVLVGHHDLEGNTTW